MLSQYNIVYTNDILIETIEEPDIAGWKVVSYLPMAHIAERMVEPLQHADGGLRRATAAPTSTRSRRTCATCVRSCCSVCRACTRRSIAGVNAALAADPDKQAPVRRRRGAGDRDQARAGRRDRHPGSARHVGLPRCGGVLGRPRADRARPAAHGDKRRGADPGRRSSSGSPRSACRCRRSTACPSRPGR